jgi:hypothetical protein
MLPDSGYGLGAGRFELVVFELIDHITEHQSGACPLWR